MILKLANFYQISSSDIMANGQCVKGMETYLEEKVELNLSMLNSEWTLLVFVFISIALRKLS